ncbi:MAG: aldehyde dehydrogenase family protein, partial [bacterium]
MEIKTILQNQRDFFATGKTKDFDFRIEQLKILRKAISENEEKILNAVYNDLRRPKFDAYITETGACFEHISHTIKNIKKWACPEKVKGPRSFFFSKGKIIYEPFGITLIIGPWNYPFALAICPLIAAIGAGNCAVIKPSEISSHTAQVIDEMISKYFKPEYIAVMQGNAAFTGELLTEKFDFIFFTGGTKVGKVIMEAAAKNLTPLALELGGKSPCIIDKDVDVEKAAKRITWGKFLNAGQTCVAPDYLLVHKDVKGKIISAIKDKICKFYGNDIKKSAGFARIINKNHFERLSAYLK